MRDHSGGILIQHSDPAFCSSFLIQHSAEWQGSTALVAGGSDFFFFYSLAVSLRANKAARRTKFNSACSGAQIFSGGTKGQRERERKMVSIYCRSRPVQLHSFYFLCGLLWRVSNAEGNIQRACSVCTSHRCKECRERERESERLQISKIQTFQSTFFALFASVETFGSALPSILPGYQLSFILSLSALLTE